MKKLSFVASMLLVSLSTAGAMVAGQSFAAQSDTAPCAHTSNANTGDFPAEYIVDVK